MSDFVNGTLMGATGAGAGYMLATQKTAEVAKEATALVEQQQKILDVFEKLGYKEGMDLTDVAQKNTMKNYEGMRSHGVSFEKANSKKALSRAWNKTMRILQEKIPEFEKLKEPVKEAMEKLAEVKNLRKSYAIVGAAAGIGVYTLVKMAKALFGGKKA